MRRESKYQQISYNPAILAVQYGQKFHTHLEEGCHNILELSIEIHHITLTVVFSYQNSVHPHNLRILSAF
jgi:hypothetical protein